jgi:hypothetical protein
MKSSEVILDVHVTFSCSCGVIHLMSGSTWSVYFRASFTSSFNKNPLVSKHVLNQFSFSNFKTGINSFICKRHSHQENVTHPSFMYSLSL